MSQGCFLVLTGVDGSGKSTVANLVQERCSQVEYCCVRMHWRPYLLPSPKRFYGGKPTYDQTNPHARSLHSWITSLLLAIYYFCDFWLGYLFLVAPSKRRGRIILYERYYYDLLFDPARHRLRALRAFVILSSLLPRPDHVVVLHGDERALRDRKPELPLEEIRRQQQTLRSLLPTSRRVHWLDVTCSGPMSVADTVCSLLELA